MRGYRVGGAQVSEKHTGFVVNAGDATAADVQKNYTASQNIDALIDKAREDMERAAKSLDFLAAAKFRDRMYELQKLREENRKK